MTGCFLPSNLLPQKLCKLRRDGGVLQRLDMRIVGKKE